MMLTALQLFWFARERLNSRQIDYLCRNWYQNIDSRQHNHPHHGELPPPLAAWILYLHPIKRKCDAGKEMGGSTIEEI